MAVAITKNDSSSGKKIPDKYLDKSRKLIEKIISEVGTKESAMLVRFIRQFYLHAPQDYLNSYDAKTIILIAKSFFSFIEKRPNEEARKVRIHNPSIKADGFEAARSFVEININDMPFLIDSVSAEITKQNYKIYQVLHPVAEIKRDKAGNVADVFEKKTEGSAAESVIHFEITHIESTEERANLKEAIENVLSYVNNAVVDWQPMLAKMKSAIESLSGNNLSFKADQVNEARDFLSWIYNNNFTFLGFVEYKFNKKNSSHDLEILKDSELGVFRMRDGDYRPHGFESMPKSAIDRSINSGNLVDITKSNRKSLVHRPVQMDYIGVKVFDKAGEVVGEKLFIGLFTSTVYYQSAAYIPIIRKKLESIVNRSGFKPEGHNGKTLVTVLETYPRDELLQISEEELFENCLEIVELQKRPRVRLFARKDAFERFMSVLIFVPRERFNTNLRERIQSILQSEFAGEVTDHYTQITDSPLARLHLIIKIDPASSISPNIKAIEERVTEIANSWHEGLRDMLVTRLGEKIGEKLAHKYDAAFPDAFVNRYNFGSGVCDVLKVEEALDKQGLSLELYKLLNDAKDSFQLKIYHPLRQLTLSEILPVLENMGFVVIDEYSFLVSPPQHKSGIWIHHFSLKDTSQKNDDIKFEAIKKEFEETFLKIQNSEIEGDLLNKLVLRAALNWRDVEILRSYSKYMVQTVITYSYNFISDVLSKHSHIAKLLIKLFHARFTLEKTKNREQECANILSEIERLLLDVTNVAEDRTIRSISDSIMATLRTNFFQKDSSGNFKSYISIKMDSSKVPNLPLPKPFREIFVYSYKVEAIHLRGGKVARGGLRWSDRREDFRTEVLGLMKAQMVKNAVIVPVGSKGGFVVKHPPESREEFMKEGIECYKTFLRGLLDITDNIVAGKIVPPENVIRHDDDDPYLVVAADKGTATFSDTANNVSKEYGFWLGDAFASGGSAGYDHKKMGITARGGWVSVRRHFREMGVDIDKQNFTVVGVGDMAGDVFGNGMLLSKNLELIAAFNHQHIFIDPTPDTAKSYKERERLFNLPRSSWLDYDQKTISKGGGVFERKAKSIKISSEARKALSLEDKESFAPDELIRSILRAPVDLLWNGGIGTYVKSSDESNESVGDRANDALRINGNEVGAKLVGEGGNLGFTQLGRIEYAMQGGRINTDAIDNSAGVDCSDHEVNIKIAFSNALSKKKLSVPERDKILADMTDEVASLVLRDNVLQTQAITLSELQGATLLEQQARLMNRLEKTGLLKRKIEFLPDNDEIKDRLAHKQGLTRPELAVLLAYSKIDLYNNLITSTLPDDPYFSNDLILYFPIAMREKFKNEINEHQLKREIIATFVTNSLVNRVGLSFAGNLMEETGMKGCDVARAYTIVRDSFNLRPLWREIESLENRVPVKTIVEMFVQINNLIERSSAWLLRNCSHPLDVDSAVKKFSSGIERLTKSLDKIISPVNRETFAKKFKSLADAGVPKELAERISYLEPLSSSFDVVNVAEKGKLGTEVAGEIYFALSTRLSLSWLRESARRIASESHWQRLAVKSLINELYDQQTRIAGQVIEDSCDDDKCDLALKAWQEKNEKELERFDNFVSDLKANEFVDFSMLVVAVQKLKTIN